MGGSYRISVSDSAHVQWQSLYVLGTPNIGGRRLRSLLSLVLDPCDVSDDWCLSYTASNKAVTSRMTLINSRSRPRLPSVSKPFRPLTLRVFYTSCRTSRGGSGDQTSSYSSRHKRSNHVRCGLSGWTVRSTTQAASRPVNQSVPLRCTRRHTVTSRCRRVTWHHHVTMLRPALLPPSEARPTDAAVPSTQLLSSVFVFIRCAVQLGRGHDNALLWQRSSVLRHGSVNIQV